MAVSRAPSSGLSSLFSASDSDHFSKQTSIRNPRRVSRPVTLAEMELALRKRPYNGTSVRYSSTPKSHKYLNRSISPSRRFVDGKSSSHCSVSLPKLLPTCRKSAYPSINQPYSIRRSRSRNLSLTSSEPSAPNFIKRLKERHEAYHERMGLKETGTQLCTACGGVKPFKKICNGLICTRK